jgi:hypothetical protein
MMTDLPYRTTVNAACTVTAKEYRALYYWSAARVLICSCHSLFAE